MLDDVDFSLKGDLTRLEKESKKNNLQEKPLEKVKFSKDSLLYLKKRRSIFKVYFQGNVLLEVNI
jgi:hypothetical protein